MYSYILSIIDIIDIIIYYNPAQENNYGQGSTERRNKNNAAVEMCGVKEQWP